MRKLEFNLENFREEENKEKIRNYAWCLGIILDGQEDKMQADILSAFIEKIKNFSLIDKCYIVDNICAFINKMNDNDQISLIDIYAELLKCTSCNYCCKDKVGVLKTYSKIAHRVSVKAKRRILEHIESLDFKEIDSDIYDELMKIIMNDDNEITIDIKNFNSKKIKINKNKKNVTIGLVVPDFLAAGSFLQPPVDMLMAAAQLRNAGYIVKFIDNRVKHYSLKQLAEVLKNIDIFVVTTTPYDHIQNYFIDYRIDYAFKNINVLKSYNPDSIVIACGAHGTVRPDIVFKETLTDYIIRWEYDYHVLTLVNAIVSNENVDIIKNICTRDNYKNEVVSMIPDHCEYDLNDGILPAYDLIDFNDYYGDVYVENKLTRKKNWGVVLASRGCPNNCSFCFNFWGRKVRFRKPENVVRELEYLYKERNVRDIFFIDFHLTVNKKWIEEICDLIIDKKLKINWSAQVRCDSVSYDLVAKMAKANCKALWFGVESFDCEIIKKAQKYEDSNIAIKAIKNCLKVGIQPNQFIMVGLPGESINSINKTLKKVYDLKMPYTESILIASPRFGTRYYDMAKSQFEQLGHSFTSLMGVKGIVDNEILPCDIQKTDSVYKNRDFIFDDSFKYI